MIWSRMRIWWRDLFDRRALDRELDDEFQFHLEMEIDERLRNGMTAQAARRSALIAFGGVERFRQGSRDVRGGRLLEDWWRDTVQAVRGLARRPVFAAAAIATVGLGIGASVLVFAVVDGVLLHPLPYEHPAQIVTVWDAARDGRTLGFTEPEFIDHRDRNPVFARFAGHVSGTQTITGGGDPEEVGTTWMTEHLFGVLGVRPALGRTFTTAEMQPNEPLVVVVSDGMWRRRFGADPGVVGSTVMLSGNAHQVIGVTPPGFEFPTPDIQLWKPLRIDEADPSSGNRYLATVGRLRDGIDLASARDETNAWVTAFRGEHEERWPDGVNTMTQANVITLADLTVGSARLGLWIAMGAVVFVLLIACVNVANLLLTRDESRRKALAIQRALGAGSARLVRQLLAENAVLAATGAGFGLGFAAMGVFLLDRLRPAGLPRLTEIGLDGDVLTFAAVTATVTCVAFGCIPAWRALGHHGHAMTDAVRGHDNQRRWGRVSAGLVVGQVALALVLVTGAGLLARSYARLVQVDAGFEPDGVTTFSLLAPSAQYPSGPSVQSLYQRVVLNIRALPGVTAVGAIHQIPLGERSSDASLDVEGYVPAEDEPSPNADYRLVIPGYFDTLGIPLIRGRRFEDADIRALPEVVIVSRAMAARYWPGLDPVGRRIRFTPTDPWMTVIGLADDVRHHGLDAPPRPMIYLPLAPLPFGGTARRMTVAIRADGDPGSLVESSRRRIWALDPDLPVSDVRTLQRTVAESISGPRFILWLMSAFAAIAIALAGIGIYGVMAFTARRQTHEIGIRLALGAGRGAVQAMVLSRAMRLLGMGIVLGGIGAITLTRLLSGLLFEVTPGDPVTFLTVATLLVAVGVAASAIPAWRASRVDPVIAFKSDST